MSLQDDNENLKIVSGEELIKSLLVNETEDDSIKWDNEFESDHESDPTLITIQTHDKRFHADDVGAISLLTSYYNNQPNTNVTLIRSRDKSLLETSDIIVDVGGIYNPDTHRYDHHQEECNETFFEFGKIPMSSIGMVWKHFGKELLGLYIQAQVEFAGIDFGIDFDVDYENKLHDLHGVIYSKIILEIDAHDNGVVMIEGGKRNFWSNMNISSIIGSLNTSNINDEVEQMKAFEKAVSLFGTVFEIKLREVIRKYFDYNASYEIVKTHLENIPYNREYLIITTEKIDTIYKCLNKLDPNYQIKFLIFHNPEEDKNITIRTRSTPENFFVPIIPLLSEKILKDRLGDNSDDLIFVHKNLFIAKTTTIESAFAIVGHSLIENSKYIRSSETVPQSYLNLNNLKPRGIGEWLLTGAMAAGGLVLAGVLLKNNESLE